jgi:hypothetical protein
MSVLVRDKAAKAAVSDPEALIEEARRRAWRRRRRRGIVAALLFGAAALAYFASDGSHNSGGGMVGMTAHRPFVNVRAFSHEGELAFVSRQSLWVLDSAARSLRRLPVPAGYTPASPVFSHDGRWLAYLATVPNSAGPPELWLARGDGAGAREVAGLPISQLVGWSPRGDTLAVVALSKGRYVTGAQGQLPLVVELIRPTRPTTRLLALSASTARPSQIYDAVWSPDGHEVAVSINDPVSAGGTVVRAYPINGGPPVTWFSIGSRQPLPGGCGSASGCQEVVADLAGWWPGWGIGFWVYADGMTHNNDSTALELLTAPDARPHVIAQTLSDGVTDAVAAGRDGELALVASSNDSGRTYTQGKTVETCNAHTRNCTPLAAATVWTGSSYRPTCPNGCGKLQTPPLGARGSGVSLDPAWSPAGNLLAYVKAPNAFPGIVSLSWYDAHVLFVWNPKSDATRKIVAVDGVSAPTWSTNGRQLLYVSNDGLWLAPLGGKPTEIEYPLFPPQQWKSVGTNGLSYYGQIDWTGQFNWSAP